MEVLIYTCLLVFPVPFTATGSTAISTALLLLLLILMLTLMLTLTLKLILILTQILILIWDNFLLLNQVSDYSSIPTMHFFLVSVQFFFKEGHTTIIVGGGHLQVC